MTFFTTLISVVLDDRVVVLADGLIHGENLEFAPLANADSRCRGRIVHEALFGTFISS